LSTVVKLFNSLVSYVDDIREQFTVFESQAKSRLPHADYSDTNRRVRQRSTRITFFDGPAAETVMDSRTTFRVSTFMPVVDSTEL